MKIARGIRGAAVGMLSLVTVAATSASAASTPAPPPGSAQPAAHATAVQAGTIDDQVADEELAKAAPQPAPRKAAATESMTAEPRATTAVPGTRAKPRFDMDGDGKDELVVRGFASPGGGAVHIRYSGLARREVLTGPTIDGFRHQFSGRFTAGDFNGDGFQDLAVAGFRMPSEGVYEQGILVYYGGSAGLDRNNVTYLAGPNPRALASGDLNNDGRDELALSENVPRDDDNPFVGSVTVLSGSTDGLTKDGAMTVRQVVPRWQGLVAEDFGNELAIGDFTGDGYDDLVVAGSRRAANASDGHGMLTLFPGSANGPSTAKVTKIEGSLDTAGTSFPVDIMTMSDMDQDGRADLILGMPRYAGGTVIYLRGASSGLAWAGHRVIDQNTPGVPGPPDDDPTGGHFGSALATGDVTGDGIPDLLVGAMAMTVGTVEDAGSVTLIPGTPTGPTGVGSFVYTQREGTPVRNPKLEGSARTAGERPEPNDYLGSAVAILDLDGTGPLEMFAEAKYEDLFQQPPGEPFGLISSLRLLSRQKVADGAPLPSGSRLVAVQHQRPSDFSASGVQVTRLGYGLLSR